MVEMRKMSRRRKSRSLDLKQFLFKFMTQNVFSHKCVELNKLSIFFANVRISGNLPLSVNSRKVLVSDTTLVLTLQLNESVLKTPQNVDPMAALYPFSAHQRCPVENCS